MKAEEIREIWDAIVFEESDKGDTAWHKVRQRAAAEIARLSEAEILIEYNLAEERGLKRDLALAQLAEMRGAMNHWLDWIERIKANDGFMQLNDEMAAKQMALQALSAAPQMLWSKRGVLCEDPEYPTHESIEVRQSMDGDYLEWPNFEPSADFWNGRKIRLVMLADEVADEG